jgi:hypothetical protein
VSRAFFAEQNSTLGMWCECDVVLHFSLCSSFCLHFAVCKAKDPPVNKKCQWKCTAGKDRWSKAATLLRETLKPRWFTILFYYIHQPSSLESVWFFWSAILIFFYWLPRYLCLSFFLYRYPCRWVTAKYVVLLGSTSVEPTWQWHKGRG